MSTSTLNMDASGLGVPGLQLTGSLEGSAAGANEAGAAESVLPFDILFDEQLGQLQTPEAPVQLAPVIEDLISESGNGLPLDGELLPLEGESIQTDAGILAPSDGALTAALVPAPQTTSGNASPPRGAPSPDRLQEPLQVASATDHSLGRADLPTETPSNQATLARDSSVNQAAQAGALATSSGGRRTAGDEPPAEVIPTTDPSLDSDGDAPPELSVLTGAEPSRRDLPTAQTGPVSTSGAEHRLGEAPSQTAIPSIVGATGRSSVADVPLAASVESLEINLPFREAGWDQALGSRVLWMAGKDIQGANIRLNPAELGPVEVQLSMDGDAASVRFSSEHVVVREAIEAAMPRLREMFQSNGINLASVEVAERDLAQQGAGQESSGDGRGGESARTSENSDETLKDELSRPIHAVHQGMIDTFA